MSEVKKTARFGYGVPSAKSEGTAVPSKKKTATFDHIPRRKDYTESEWRAMKVYVTDASGAIKEMTRGEYEDIVAEQRKKYAEAVKTNSRYRAMGLDEKQQSGYRSLDSILKSTPETAVALSTENARNEKILQKNPEKYEEYLLLSKYQNMPQSELDAAVKAESDNAERKTDYLWQTVFGGEDFQANDATDYTTWDEYKSLPDSVGAYSVDNSKEKIDGMAADWRAKGYTEEQITEGIASLLIMHTQDPGERKNARNDTHVNRELTAAEKMAFAEIWNTKGRDAAEQFLDETLRGVASYRAGQKIVDSIGDNPFLRLGWQVKNAAGENIMGWEVPETAEKAPSANQYASMIIHEDFADVGPKVAGKSLGQWADTTATTLGDMLPNIVVSQIAGLGGETASRIAGGAWTFGSSYGRNVQNALNEGKTYEEATQFSFGSSLSEAGLEVLFSSIGKVGKSVYSKLTKKATGEIFEGVTKAFHKAHPKMAKALKWAQIYTSKGAGEAFEEWAQTAVVDPTLRNVVYGENNKFEPFSEEAVEAIIVSGLLTSVLDLGGAVTYDQEIRKPNKIANALLKKTEGIKGIEGERSILQEKISDGSLTMDDIVEFIDRTNGYGVSSIYGSEAELTKATAENMAKVGANRAAEQKTVNVEQEDSIAGMNANPEKESSMKTASADSAAPTTPAATAAPAPAVTAAGTTAGGKYTLDDADAMIDEKLPHIEKDSVRRSERLNAFGILEYVFTGEELTKADLKDIRKTPEIGEIINTVLGTSIDFSSKSALKEVNAAIKSGEIVARDNGGGAVAGAATESRGNVLWPNGDGTNSLITVEEAERRKAAQAAEADATGASAPMATQSGVPTENAASASGISERDAKTLDAISRSTAAIGANDPQVRLVGMLSGNISNATADRIANTPALAKAFSELAGVELTGSVAQQRRTIKEKAAAVSETFRIEQKAKTARVIESAGYQNSAEPMIGEGGALGAYGKAAYKALQQRGTDAYVRGGLGAAAVKHYNAEFGAYYRQGFSGVGFSYMDTRMSEADARAAYEAGIRDAAIADAATLTEKSGILYGASKKDIDTALRLAKAFGKDVIFINRLGSDNFGGCYTDDGNIYLQAGAKDPIVQIVAHEFVHSLESKKLYKDLREFVFAELKRGGKTEAQLRAEIRKNSAYRDMEDPDVDKEIVARFVAEHLLTDEDTIRRIVQAKGRTFAQKLHDLWNALIAKAKSAFGEKTDAETQRQIDMIERGRKLLAKVIKSEEVASDGGVRNMYAGKHAKTADLSKLEEAMRMESEGTGSEEIRKATGWHKGYDGKWRFEIDDSKMSFVFDETVIGGRGTLAEFIKHDELFAAYPELRGYTVHFKDLGKNKAGMYSAGERAFYISTSLTKEQVRTTMLHEIQHAVQHIEGFASGATSEYWNERITFGYDTRPADTQKREEELHREYDRIRMQDPKFFADMVNLTAFTPTVPRGKVDFETLQKLEEDSQEWQDFDERRDALEEKYGAEKVIHFMDLEYRIDQIASLDKRDGFALYYSTAGEIEARDVSARADLDAEQRKNTRPDVDQKDVVFADGGESDFIGETDDGRPVVVVNDDITKYASNDKSLVKLVKQSIGKFPFVAISRQKIFFIDDTKRETTYSKYTNWLRKNDSKVYKDKMRLFSHPSEIVLATTDFVNEGLNHQRKDDIIDFARGKLLIDVLGEQYSAEVVIGFTKKGICELHDVVKLTPIKFKYKTRDALSTISHNDEHLQKRSSLATNSISNPDEKVKGDTEKNASDAKMQSSFASAKVEELRRAAVEHFGRTETWEETGYLLTDGTRLDFSGKHRGIYGRFGIEEREKIGEEFGLAYGSEEYYDGIIRFMNEGHIRVIPNAPGLGISTAKEPTAEQYSMIRDFIEKNKHKGFFIVEFSDELGNDAEIFEYDGELVASRVISDIRRFYETGEERKTSEPSKFRYSFSDDGTQGEVEDFLNEQDANAAEDEFLLKMLHYQENPDEATDLILENELGGKENFIDRAIHTKTDEALRREAEKAAKGKARREIVTKRIAKEYAKSVSWFQRKFVDSGHAVTQIGKQIKDSRLYAYYNAARASTNAAVYMLTGAQTDINGKKVGEGLNAIFAPIKEKGEAYYRDFQKYLYHLHNADRMSRQNDERTEEAKTRFAVFKSEHPELDKYAEYQIERIAESELDMPEREAAAEYIRLRDEMRREENMRNKPIFGHEVDAAHSLTASLALERLHPEFKEHRDKVYKYIENLLQYRVDSGLITAEDMEQLKGIYPHYVPTYRVTDTDAKGKQRKNRNVTVGKAIGRAIGGDEALMPLDQALAKLTMRVVREGSKNQFGRRLMYNGAVKLKDHIKNVTEYKPQGQTDAFANADAVDADTDPAFRKTNTFVVHDGGQMWEMEIGDALYEAVQALSPTVEEMSAAEQFVRAANKLYKELITGKNPFFMVKNFERDLQDAGMYTKDLKGFAKAYPRAWKEMTTNGELWQQYQALGGLYSSLLDYKTGMAENRGKKGLGKITEKIEAANMLIEQAPRFAEFISTIERGGTSHDNLMTAMHNAADITVNFGRSGTWGKYLNATIIPFFNPGVQGFDKTVRMLTDNHGAREWMRLVAKALLLGIAPSVINALAAALFDWDEWEDIKDRDKDTYYLIRIGDGKYVKIPKGRVTAALSMTAARVYDVASGDDVNFGEYLSAMSDQIAPANPFESNVVMPWVQTALFDPENPGKTWYGGDIESQRLQNYAPSERYDEKTDIVSRWIGKATGLSPKKINYLLDSYTGVVGDILLPALVPNNGGLDAVGNVFEKNFVLDAVSTNKLNNDFYTMLDSVTYNKNSPEATAMDKLLYKYMNKRSQAVSEVNAAIKKIESDPNLSNKERAELLRAQQMLRNTVEKNAMDQISAFYRNAEYFYKHADGDEEEKLDWAYLMANKMVFGSEYAIETYSKSTYKKAQECHAEGVSYDDFFNYYFAANRIELSGTEKTNEKRTILLNMRTDEDTKISLYRAYISDSRDDDIRDFSDAGLDFDTFLRVQNEYAAIDMQYDTAKEKTQAFAKWVKKQNFTKKQNVVVLDCFKYFMHIPQ